MTALAYALEGTRPAAPIRFAPVEPITFDADVLEAFCRLEGAAAEEAIGSVLMEIEERLILAHWQAARGEWGGLRRSADTLTALGNRIGRASCRERV